MHAEKFILQVLEYKGQGLTGISRTIHAEQFILQVLEYRGQGFAHV